MRAGVVQWMCQRAISPARRSTRAWVSASTSLLRYSEFSVYVDSLADRDDGRGLSLRPVSGAYCPPVMLDKPKYESGRKLPRPRTGSSGSGDRRGDRPRELSMWDNSMGSAKGSYRAGGVVGDVDRDEYAERGPREDIVELGDKCLGYRKTSICSLLVFPRWQ
jgi:hypothetical protein